MSERQNVFTLLNVEPGIFLQGRFCWFLISTISEWVLILGWVFVQVWGRTFASAISIISSSWYDIVCFSDLQSPLVIFFFLISVRGGITWTTPFIMLISSSSFASKQNVRTSFRVLGIATPCFRSYRANSRWRCQRFIFTNSNVFVTCLPSSFLRAASAPQIFLIFKWWFQRLYLIWLYVWN